MTKQPNIILNTPSKGYVFKCKVSISPNDKLLLIKRMTEQLYKGILIYDDDALLLVDSYELNTKEITTNDKIINLL